MTAIKVAIAIGLVLAYLYAAMFTHVTPSGFVIPPRTQIRTYR